MGRILQQIHNRSRREYGYDVRRTTDPHPRQMRPLEGEHFGSPFLFNTVKYVIGSPPYVIVEIISK